MKKILFVLVAAMLSLVAWQQRASAFGIDFSDIQSDIQDTVDGYQQAGKALEDALEQANGGSGGHKVIPINKGVVLHPINPSLLSVLEDDDDDGVRNYQDNCDDVANDDQADLDGDKIGDACDDSDGDGIMDSEDNCAEIANDNQMDLDTDGIGDACDDDLDGDLVENEEDNCVTVANEEQDDSENDGFGDLCDACPEEAGISENDGCPLAQAEEDMSFVDAPALSDDGFSVDGDSSCSMVPGGSADPLNFLILGLALLPIVRRRLK